MKKLPKDLNSGYISLDNDVTLDYYRIEETFSGDNRISEAEDISGVTHAGSGSKLEEEIESLSEIIKIFMSILEQRILQKVINSLLIRYRMTYER